MKHRSFVRKYEPVREATELARHKRFGGFVSRQTLRRAMYEQALAEISEQYPGETRHMRKTLARARVKNDWRKRARSVTAIEWTDVS